MIERLGRALVLVSLGASLASYGWLTSDARNLAWTAAVAFAATALVSRFSLPAALAIPLLLTYVTPALFASLFGAADYHQLFVWLAALAGPLLFTSDWRRWHLPPTWRWPLITWAILLAITWPIVAGREIDFSLIAARTQTSNGLMVGSPAQTAAWVVSVAAGQLLAILWIDFLWAKFAGRTHTLERVVLLPMLMSALISAAAGIYQDWIDLAWASDPHWASAGRATGLLLDANSFGTSAALWSAAGVALVWRLGASSFVAFLVFFPLAAGMWASGSRTALIAAGISAVGLARALMHRGWKARLVPLGARIAVAVAIVALALGNREMEQGSPLKRALESLPPAESRSLANAVNEFRTRHGYGLAAERAIAEHTVSGVGVGAFNPLSTGYYYLASGETIRPDNAQNWWRHQVAELGVLGAIPSIVFSVVILLLLARPAPPEHNAVVIVLKATIVSMGVISLLGLSTQHPSLLLTFVTFVVWLGALVGLRPAGAATSAHRPTAISRAAAAAIVLLPIGTAIGQAWSATHDLRVPHRALRFGFLYAYGFSAAEPAPGPGEVRWTDRHAVAVLPAIDRYLELTMWTMNPDVGDRPVRVRIWKDGEPAIDLEARDQQPVRRTLAMREGQRWVAVEIDVSRTFGNSRGLRVSPRWLREPSN